MQDHAEAVEIRPGTGGDLEELTRIYNHYVTGTPITFDLEPFTVDERKAWLDAHPEHGPHRLLVADVDGRALGYATSSPFRPKQAYLTSVETSVYLAPDAGGRGLGTRLYEALFEALAEEDVHRAYAAITVPNEASYRIHERFGFEPRGVFTEVGRKFGRYWDVAWFEKRLQTDGSDTAG
ncbi:Phosphinothricin N-acetyltransferase [Streptomyces sp. YIM 130001]|uniref:GNAT family N-acetyltransferase n=1 Tax=Streptomyces sp. YIM 130001 TaxID=2259644 RepID=UPI000E65E73C|nr:GNAT family N-acetyltransferase [Streptomyces sp. YIM 130001]RII14612.1 Phosphinothricin N-acetyltransferase [Streptomyces sp. YIM 130001]